MTPSDIDAAMARAVAALGRPCHATIAPCNLIRAREDGWCCIGTITIPEEMRAWEVFFNPELDRGWLWGMHWTERGVQPRLSFVGAEYHDSEGDA